MDLSRRYIHIFIIVQLCALISFYVYHRSNFHKPTNFKPINLTIAPENFAFTFLIARFGRNDPFTELLNNKKKSIISNNIAQLKSVVMYTKFPDFILEDPKYNEHLKFYNRPVLSTTNPKSNNEQQRKLSTELNNHFSQRGAGYWFWKSAIITHLLDHANTNDRHNSKNNENFFLGTSDNNFLIYSDADYELNFSFWSPLVNTFHNGNYDFAAQHMDYIEKHWTKGDIFEHFNQRDPDGDAWNSGQFQGGGFFTARITLGTRRFFSALARCVSNFSLINDSPSKFPNDEGFRENRHDQSFFSLLLKSNSDFKKPYGADDNNIMVAGIPVKFFKFGDGKQFDKFCNY